MPILLNVENASAYLPLAIGLSDWGAHDPESDARESDQPAVNLARMNLRYWMQPIVPQDERPKSAVFSESNGSLLIRQQWAEARQRDSDYAHIIT